VLFRSAIRESGGPAIAVDDDHIEHWAKEVASRDGLLMAPEGAATVAAWEVGLERGDIAPDDRVVLFNCGNGLKYPMPPADRVLDVPVDWDRMEAEAAAERAGRSA
jgi:threonine synthase